MPLRARLTLLYAMLLGGILLLFGLILYGVVRVILIGQIDKTLVQTFEEISKNIHVKALGNIDIISLPSLNLTADVYVQAWGRDNQLQSTNLGQFSQPFDPQSVQSTRPVFRDVYFEKVHLRVLSIPLIISDRPIGWLQLATSLTVVDSTQRALLIVLTTGTLISMILAGLAGWFTTRQALAPLESVTQTALQITRADDLSRRIPYQGPSGDEVGQLIHAFNQTLGRLENLFNTQRRFLADVGHELRTPLTVIKGNVDLIRRMGKEDTESLDGIESEVDRLTRLVGDILLLAQAESGKIPLDWRMIELDTVLLEVLNRMRVLARKGPQLRLGDVDQVLVCGDQDRIKQVLVNLIGNAIKYTPLTGEIVVGIGKLENQARLTISDNGPGIPTEDLPHVFERFYRGEKSRTRSADGKGFGLGLSIAYWIVRNHGGRIEVNSVIGQGTTFCVWLPLAEGNCQKRVGE